MGTNPQTRNAKRLGTTRWAWRLALTAAVAAMLGCAAIRPTPLADAERAYREGRTDDAEFIWREVLADSKTDGTEDRRIARSLRLLANLQIQQGRYDDAQWNLERWLRMADQRGADGGDVYADVLDAMAGIHTIRGKPALAIELYARSVQIRTDDASANRTSFAHTLENLGRVYRAVGSRDAAERSFSRALTLREKSFEGARTPRAAALHHELALLYLAQDKPEASEKHLRVALEIQQENGEADSPTTAGMLHTLGDARLRQRDATEAEIHLENARGIREQTLGPRHPLVAESIALQGLVHSLGKRKARAEHAFVEAIAIWEDHPPLDPLALARTLANFAQLRRAQGRAAEAAALYGRAIPIFRDRLGADHPTTRRAFVNAAHARSAAAWGATGQPDTVAPPQPPAAAVRFYQQAIARLETSPQPAPPLELRALTARLAWATARSSEPAKAVPLYDRTLELLGTAHGSEHEAIGRVLKERADVHTKLGEWDRALAGYEQALALHEQTLPEDHPELAATLDSLAVLLVRQRDFDRAEQLLERALGIHESTDPVDPVAFGHTLSSLGFLYASQNRIPAAETALDRALELLEPALGEADPLVLETRREYDLVVRARRIGAREVEGL